MATGEHAFGRPTRRRPPPPPSPPAGPAVAERDSGLPTGHPDPEAAAPGLRRLRAGGRRWTFALLAAAALIGGCFAVQHELDRAADLLLRTGVHSDGTVLAVRRKSKAGAFIEVGYVFGGAPKRVWIDHTSDREYAVGDHVVVATDPARPARVRTADEPNEDRATSSAAVLMLIAGVVLFPVGVVRRIRWGQRLAAARRTGWYPAEVTIAPHRRLTAADHHPPDLRITYRDGPTIDARGAHAYGVAELADRPRRAVWVAGTGDNLAVLFPAGVKGKRPYLVPARVVPDR
ncbi:DUF3592 domain-containing protein [Amycolatopsis sp. cmx-4-61]|uniref:DUF3592 domain-containing protein n=1 Tax=Amycolatopsis sp. cmx-4-61 TaxID=2790937 RepID=UPI0039795287